MSTEKPTWGDRFNALLCEYLREEYELDVVEISSTHAINRSGCDTCDYGSFYGTCIYYVNSQGDLLAEEVEIDLADLIG